MATTWNQFMKRLKADAKAAGPVHVQALKALRDHYAQLGRQLAEERRKLGVSQDALAAATGVDQAEISRIEREVVDPRLTTYQKLLGGLGLGIHVEPISGRRLSPATQRSAKRSAARAGSAAKPARSRPARGG
ncbi:MAG: helix-turn-helix domain-containing protein [Myxococcaceae bacterium]